MTAAGRQEVLFLYLADSDLAATVVGWAHHRPGDDELGPLDTPPYERGTDALADGWRLIQSSPVPAPMPGHEHRSGPLEHEFVFERREVDDAPRSESSGISLVALVVDDYDEAIEFYTGVLGFELVEDSPSLTNDGRPKRWVVVRPRGAFTGLLLALADGDEQAAVVGRQAGGRVGFFLRVDDFEATLDRLRAAGATIRGEPRDEPYGRVVVFEDLCGNPWDLLGTT